MMLKKIELRVMLFRCDVRAKAWTKLSIGQAGFVLIGGLIVWQICQVVVANLSQAAVGDIVGQWAEAVGWIALLGLLTVLYLLTRERN